MPSIQLKVYSFTTKFWLKRRLQDLLESSPPPISDSHPYGIVSRSGEPKVPAIPSFSGEDGGGVATKDLHIDPLSSLSMRIFLPISALTKNKEKDSKGETGSEAGKLETTGVYGGYSPDRHKKNCRKLPVILQFHGGIWVNGGNDTVSNDAFCRRLAVSCDAIVVAVGYRLAPESKYPAAFEDALKVLNWLATQANLADFDQPLRNGRFRGSEKEGVGKSLQIVDGYLATMIEPWLAAHGDPSRCVLLGVGCGANIANYVARKAVEAGNLLNPIRIVAQVLVCPFFIGNIPMDSEINLANSYIYDKATSILAWKLFLPEQEFNLDHPACNPLISTEIPLKFMPPTLTVVAEHDWMRDRAIAYSGELRKVNVDAPLLDYKDTVHEFATLGSLFKTPVSRACSEDIAIWVKKYISVRGNEFSY